MTTIIFDDADPIEIENLIIIDAGANLTNKKYTRDLDLVIKRATESGVKKIMVPGNSVRSSKEALRLSRIYPDIIYSTAGIHPHDSKSVIETPSSWNEFEDIAKSPECVAIGPCGLDIRTEITNYDIQKQIFEKQISLACRLNKPIIVQERSTQSDILEILGKYTNLPSVIIRGFMGTLDEAVKYINNDCFLSLNGYLCKDKSDVGVRKLLEDGVIPLQKLLIESDSPFMFPNTRASKLPQHVKSGLSERSLLYLNRYCTFQRNEPCCLPSIVEMVAAFMKKRPHEIALATAFNSLKLFGLTN